MMRENDDLPAGFDREGHLSPLTVERIAAGELPDAASDAGGAIGEHLAGCGLCSDAVEGARAYVPPASLRPPVELRRSAAASGTGGRRRTVAIAAVVALAAAALIFALRPGGTPGAGPTETIAGDGIRIKGSFDLEIFARSGGQGEPRAIDARASVRPGDQLAFRARTSTPGHLLILGVDAKGETYPVHPPGATPSAAPLAPSATPVLLDGAIEFDATPGAETLVALLCPTSVAYATVAPRLAKMANQAARDEALPALSAECTQVVRRLNKAP